MPQDFKRRLKSDMQGGFYEKETAKSKSKPRIIDDTWFQNMVRDRERVFYAEAVINGDKDELYKIAARIGFEVRDKDLVNCK